MLSVSRENPVSLWRQVKADVRDKIVPKLRPGDQIPGENELCDRYGVSRTVVRQAINSLVTEGALFRHQGRGTFVAPRKLEQSLLGAGVLSRDLFSAAAHFDTQPISAEEILPHERVESYLRLSGRDGVYKIRRLRLSGGEPIAYQVDYLPRRLCPGLISTEQNLDSIGRALAERYGLIPTRFAVSLECITTDACRAEWLGTPEGSPLMMIERVHYLASGEPIRYSRTRYRHDRFRLVIPSIPLLEADALASQEA